MSKISYGISLKGNNHYIVGSECQDSIGFIQENEHNKFSFCGVADGHGSEVYARSKIGSMYAIEAAKEFFDEFIFAHQKTLDELTKINAKLDDITDYYTKDEGFADNLDEPDPFETKQLNEKLDQLQSQISSDFKNEKYKVISKWKTKIRNHFLNNPLMVGDFHLSRVRGSQSTPVNHDFLAYISKKDNGEISFYNPDIKETHLENAIDNFDAFYGTTLICAAIYKDHNFFLKIGDGVLVVSREDDSCFFPFEDDPECVENITTSLCQPDALVKLHSFYDQGEIHCVSCFSDGVSNALPEDQYEAIPGAILTTINKDPSSVKEQLSNLLRNCSTNSGDDVSIAFICNCTDLEKEEFNKSSDYIENNDLDKTFEPHFMEYDVRKNDFKFYLDSNGHLNMNELLKSVFRKTVLLKEFNDLLDIKENHLKNDAEITQLELALIEKQQKLYDFALNTLFDNTPITLISYNVKVLTLKDGYIDIKQEQPVLGQVDYINDKTFRFHPISIKDFNAYLNDFDSMLKCEISIRLKHHYVLKLKNNKITLEK